jgi:hypothetical protein
VKRAVSKDICYKEINKRVVKVAKDLDRMLNFICMFSIFINRGCNGFKSYIAQVKHGIDFKLYLKAEEPLLILLQLFWQRLHIKRADC